MEGDPARGNPEKSKARDAYLRDYLRNHLIVLSKDEIDVGLQKNGVYSAGDLGRCVGSMVDSIRDLPGPVDEDWLMDKIEYEKHGGKFGEIVNGVARAVQRAVTDGSAAIIRTVTSPFVADRGVDTPGERDRGDGGGDHSTPMPDIDKLPWQQLRGISAHSW